MNSCNTVIFLATTIICSLSTLNRVGHLNIILALGDGNLNDPIFKSSNARALSGGRGGGGLEFRVDRRIITDIEPRPK